MNSSSSRLVSLGMTAFLLAVLTGVSVSRAADLWWDGGTVDIAGNGDGASGGTSGTWNTATLNWDQGNGLPHVAWVNANNDAATFAGTAGTVTLGVGVTANALTFNTDNYEISSGSLTLAGATPTITVYANATIGSIIAGTNGLIKAGAGQLTLTGTNTYTGVTTLNAGALTFASGTSGGLGNFTVSGGTLQITGASVSAATGALNVNGGNVSMSGGASYFGSSAAHYIGNTSAGTWTQTGGTANFSQLNPGGAVYIGNTASGTMTISGGTLNANPAYIAGINVGSSAGTGTLIINGAGSVYCSYGITIGAKGTVNLDAGGTLMMGRIGYSAGPVAGTGTLSFNGGTFTPTQNNVSIANTVNTIVNNGGLICNNPSGYNFIIYSALAAGVGSGGLTKYGGAILTLGGTNTYTGATTVNGGTLMLDFSVSTAPQNNIVSSNSTVVLSGGTTLNVKGKNVTTHSQTFNGLTVSGGASAIRFTQNGATGITLNLGSLTQSAGGAVDFTLPTTGSITTTTTNGPGGIIGPWATIDGVNYAANDGAGNIVVYTGFVDIAALGPSVIPDDPVTPKNVRINSAGTVGGITLGAATTTINSLVQNVTTAATVTMAAQTLRASGVQINSGMQALTIGASANDGVLTALTAGGELLLGNSGTLTLTVNSAVADNTSASALAKAGTGTVTLTGTNTFTGNMTIQAGTLMIGGTGKLNGGNYAGTIVNHGVLWYGSSASQTLGGNIGGIGGITITAGTLTLNGNNTHTGGTTFNAAGTVMLGSATALGTGVVNTTPGTGALTVGITGSSLTLANNNDFTTHARPFTFISAGTLNLGTGRFDTDNNTPTVTVTDPNGILIIGGQVWSSGGSWGITKNGAGMLVLSGNNVNSGATAINAGTLTVSGGNAIPNNVVSLANTAGVTLNLASSEAIGSLAGGGTNGGNVTLNANTLTLGGDNSSRSFAGVISGSGGVTKVGTGTQTVSGTNTYSGLTTISGGALVLAQALAVRNSVISNNAVNGLQFSGGTAFTVVGLAGGADLALVNTVGAAVTLSVGATNTTTSFGGGLTGSGTLRKIGAGTLTLGGPGTFSGGVVVDEGTLVLAGTHVGGTNTAVILNAGVLDSGVQTNAWGGLTLGGDSVLRLTTGCSLSFADSSSLVWSNAMLTVAGDFPRRAVRFGTSAAGLTREQLLKIRYDGLRLTLDEDGFLAFAKAGTCIIIE